MKFVFQIHLRMVHSFRNFEKIRKIRSDGNWSKAYQNDYGTLNNEVSVSSITVNDDLTIKCHKEPSGKFLALK